MVFARELALLELLAGTAGAQGTSLGVSRAATLADMSKAQASRTFASLEAEGLVIRDPQTREYRLGWRLPALLIDTKPQRTLERVQERVARLLPLIGGFGASFGVLRGPDVLIVYGTNPSGVHRKLGWDHKSFPAHQTAGGRVLLASLSQDELDSALSGEALPAPAGDLTTSLARTRELGYAISDGEFHREQCGVAALVWGEDGRVIGSLALQGARAEGSAQEREAELTRLGAEVARAADELSHDLGWERAPVG
ncbi:MAG TPA: IclR family transcriptional regulator C-terminal domain-containing protein [Microbacteriaceae bacterium]|nr:IclR family transcriptional regulator C-terminal domain-containing protein [Microbacteriaceae bacterium]